MIFARVLDMQDKEKMLDLIGSSPKIFNDLHDDKFEQDLPQYVENWFNNPLCFMVGIFDHDFLMGAVIGIESEHTPSWTWAYWISRSKNLFETFVQSEVLNALRQGDQILFDEMENNRKLNRFFVHFGYDLKPSGIKTTGVDSRLLAIMHRYNFRISKYHIITDCIIPANTMAKYSYQRAIHGNRPWSIPTEIRLAVLIKS